MPRRSNADAAKTRAAIIDRAVETASIEGLEGVTAQERDRLRAAHPITGPVSWGQGIADGIDAAGRGGYAV